MTLSLFHPLIVQLLGLLITAVLTELHEKSISISIYHGFWGITQILCLGWKLSPPPRVFHFFYHVSYSNHGFMFLCSLQRRKKQGRKRQVVTSRVVARIFHHQVIVSHPCNVQQFQGYSFISTELLKSYRQLATQREALPYEESSFGLLLQTLPVGWDEKFSRLASGHFYIRKRGVVRG